jgi:hypothetical protein
MLLGRSDVRRADAPSTIFDRQTADARDRQLRVRTGTSRDTPLTGRFLELYSPLSAKTGQSRG